MGDEFYSLTCLIGLGAMESGVSLELLIPLAAAIANENNQ